MEIGIPLRKPSWRCVRADMEIGVPMRKGDALERQAGGSSFTPKPRELVWSALLTCPMESTLATVLLRPGEADRVVAGHPWIYSGSIARLSAPVADGEVVQVKDHHQRFLGVGLYNSKSKINVRVLDPERVSIDEAFFEQRIRAALELRRKHLPDATSFRVVNAESDFLSGLIVDKYEDVLVIQTSSLGMDQRKAIIVRRTEKDFGPARHRGAQRNGLAQIRGTA